MVAGQTLVASFRGWRVGLVACITKLVMARKNSVESWTNIFSVLRLFVVDLLLKKHTSVFSFG